MHQEPHSISEGLTKDREIAGQLDDQQDDYGIFKFIAESTLLKRISGKDKKKIIKQQRNNMK
jgi:hypothetical protein